MTEQKVQLPRTANQSEQADARPASPRGLAQLARAGFALVRKPVMRIGYEVHHVADHAGYLREVVNERQAEPSRRFVETLTSAAYGTGLVIGVRTGPDVQGRALLGQDDEVVYETTQSSRVFTGSAVPNVSFVYDPTHVFEGLIAVGGVGSQLAVGYGKAIREIIEHVAQLAADEADAPILSLQSPVQLPQPVGAVGWPSNSAVAVRFTIAVRRPNAAIRLKLLDTAAAFCQERGFGLWVTDLRSGFRAGNWFPICPHDPARVASRYRSSADSTIPTWSLPVTLVGPARVGAVQAAMAYLRDHPAIYVLACSMSIVDDVAFVHLQLGSVTVGETDLPWLNRELDSMTGTRAEKGTVSQKSLTRLLPRIVALLSATPARAQAVSQPLIGDGSPLVGDSNWRIGDFQLFTGPALPIQPRGDVRPALWVSWEIEGREDELSRPFLALYDVIQQMSRRWSPDAAGGVPPNMEYLICRRVRHATLRGKGKISLPDSAEESLGAVALQSELSALCQRIEAAWKTKLDDVLRSDRPARELTVAWRENWLGHWNQPLE